MYMHNTLHEPARPQLPPFDKARAQAGVQGPVRGMPANLPAVDALNSFKLAMTRSQQTVAHP